MNSITKIDENTNITSTDSVCSKQADGNKKLCEKVITEIFNESNTGTVRHDLVLEEPQNNFDIKSIIRFSQNNKDKLTDSMWGFFLLMCNIDLYLKKQSREDSYYQRITSFNDMNHAAEKLKKAARIMIVGSVIGGALSIGGGLLGTAFASSKILKKGLDGIGKNKAKSPFTKTSPQGEASLDIHKAKSKTRDSNLVNRHEVLDGVRQRFENPPPVPKHTSQNVNLNTEHTTPVVPKRSTSLTGSIPAIPSDVKLMSKVDRGRYLSILFDNTGRLVSGVFQGLCEIERAEKTKLEAQSALKQSFGGQEEQYCSSVADSLNKLIAQVGSIIESNIEMFRSAIKA